MNTNHKRLNKKMFVTKYIYYNRIIIQVLPLISTFYWFFIHDFILCHRWKTEKLKYMLLFYCGHDIIMSLLCKIAQLEYDCITLMFNLFSVRLEMRSNQKFLAATWLWGLKSLTSHSLRHVARYSPSRFIAAIAARSIYSRR